MKVETPPEMKRDVGYRFIRFWLYWLMVRQKIGQDIEDAVDDAKEASRHVCDVAEKRGFITADEMKGWF